MQRSQKSSPPGRAQRKTPARTAPISPVGTELPSEPGAKSASGRKARRGAAPGGQDPPIVGAHVAGGRLDVMSFNCDAINELAPHELGITYWFADQPTGAGSLSVRLDGRRDGLAGRPGPDDQFTSMASADDVVAGAGPVALTTRVGGVSPGHWTVTATPQRARPASLAPGGKASSRRGSVTASGSTTFAPFARVRAPGVRLGAWPALVGSGAVVALAVQFVLARHAGLRTGVLLLLTVAACLVGVVGGKVYYRMTHRGERTTILTTGMSIQGFVLACISALVVASALTGLEVGSVLDASAPGLMLGMSVGRWGCFLGGCCAGRPTGSRWGIWSSDRRLGMRRVPVQLIESGVAAGLGASGAFIVWRFAPDPHGVSFVATVAAYVLARQLLFPFRSLPRLTAHGRFVTLVAAGLTLVGAVAVVWAV